MIDGAVHQREGLRRDCGGVTPFAGNIGAGFVENLQHGIRQSTNAFGIERAAIALGGLGVGLIRGAYRAHDVARLHGDFLVDLRMRRYAADRTIEFP